MISRQSALKIIINIDFVYHFRVHLDKLMYVFFYHVLMEKGIYLHEANIAWGEMSLD